MTNNQFYFWIGQHERGATARRHAHTIAAVLICLKGKGYTYTWPERTGEAPWRDGKADQVRRVDYEPVGIVTAAPGGSRWYHQHFSAGPEPLRLTAWFGPHNPGRDPGAPGEQAHGLHGHGRRPKAAPASLTGWRTRTCARSTRPTCRPRHRLAHGPAAVREARGRGSKEERHGIERGGVTTEPADGGRVFFSNVRRSLEFEDEIVLVSVGVDIGSSTSHLVFSRLRLERLDSRYMVAERSRAARERGAADALRGACGRPHHRRRGAARVRRCAVRAGRRRARTHRQRRAHPHRRRRCGAAMRAPSATSSRPRPASSSR